MRHSVNEKMFRDYYGDEYHQVADGDYFMALRPLDYIVGINLHRMIIEVRVLSSYPFHRRLSM